MRLRVLVVLIASLSAFAEGRAIAPRSAGPAANLTGHATTAFSRNRFLTIWPESMGQIGAPMVGILHAE